MPSSIWNAFGLDPDHSASLQSTQCVTGAVVSLFVYGTSVNVPDYMERGGQTYRLITDHLVRRAHSTHRDQLFRRIVISPSTSS